MCWYFFGMLGVGMAGVVRWLRGKGLGSAGIISIFFMSLFCREDLLHKHQFFIYINVIKHGVPMRDMHAVNDNAPSQNQFFFIAVTSRKRIFFQTFQGCFYYSACFFWQMVDII